MTESKDVDALDRAIIDRLKQDARATNRSIAEALDVTEQTVAARIRRLEDAKLLRVMAVLDMQAAGYGRFVIAGIQVSGRPPSEVAAEIAALPFVSGLASCLGGFELVATLYARDEADLFEQLERRIGSVRGVEDIESFLVLEQILHRVDWASMEELTPLALRPLSGSGLDELDRAIVEQLQENGRTSLREVGRRLDRSEGTIRARLRRMEADGICRLQAVTDISVGPGLNSVWVAIKARRGWVRRVAETIAKAPEAGFVGITLGRFDVIALVVAAGREELSRLVFEQVALIGGVQRVEAWGGLQSFKNDFRIAKLSASRALPSASTAARSPRARKPRRTG
jgi:DNA-binding Lrp family transcriptional regulator